MSAPDNTDDCRHSHVVKRPESGPGSCNPSEGRPGEWFCNDCPDWWATYEAFLNHEGVGRG